MIWIFNSCELISLKAFGNLIQKILDTNTNTNKNKPNKHNLVFSI